MKYETRMRCLTFVDNNSNTKVFGNRVCNAVTGKRGPTIDVMRQAVTEGFVTIEPGEQFALTDKGRKALAPTKCKKLVFLVPVEHVATVNALVAKYTKEK